MFDSKRTNHGLINDLNQLVQEVTTDESIAINQRILEEDDDTIVVDTGLDDTGLDDTIVIDSQDQDMESVTDIHDDSCRQDDELLTPPYTDESDTEFAALIARLVRLPVKGFETKGVDEDTLIEPLSDDRLKDFECSRTESALHGAFNARRRFDRLFGQHRRDLPIPPTSYRELDSHPLQSHFKEAEEQHLGEHARMKTFREVSQACAKGQQILGCMWVYTYKCDKHGRLVKCKARLVVCGNQQAPGDLPTRATTLAGTSFRTIMAIAARFDLETRQLDAVNAFVNCDLDEVVFMRLPPGYTKPGRVLRLQKALYGLRRSPLL